MTIKSAIHQRRCCQSRCRSAAADRRTRAQRWYDTVAELIALQAEYAAWHDALPDSLRDNAAADCRRALHR
jgi:hypothetical protein